PDSELARAANQKTIRVNSLHHQAVKEVAQQLKPTARGEDGTIEGIETSDGMVVAVQCHPEELADDLTWARNLFERFVTRARASASGSGKA
ncbi:MAG TPA: gamma-glutamyl-gamma-aminobutyrate hydrolase family protein, partial [Candidatus Dormibacteraeota bacterium]|nr:gamma-glutamyl-gamma-aminobutyrate hydrolase family protein [Candidatus Dormibacteraeota bacterium]